MPDITDDSPADLAGAWLKRHEPGWLKPAMTAVSVLDAATIVAQAWLIATAASAVFVDGAAPGEVMLAMWMLLAVLLARAGLTGLRGMLAADASARVRRSLRESLLNALRRGGPVHMGSSGALVPAFDEQVEALDGYYSRFLPQRISAMLIPLVVLVFVFSNDWVAGALLMLSAPLIPLFMALIGMGAEKVARDQFRAMARLSGWFLDRIQGAPTLRLFGAEKRTLDDVRRRTEQLRQETMRVLRLAFLSSASLEFFSSVAIASVAIYVGLGLFGSLEFGPAPSLTLASGLFILLLAPEFFQPLRALSQGWHDRADARAAVAEVHAIIDRPAARPEADPEFSVPPGSRCTVTVRGLRFAHPGRARLFEGVDLDIAAGERVALVGPSGGGKSTLISLLAGFLHPDGGELRLEGNSLVRLSDEALRAHVAWLGQRPMLLAGTIAENIGLAAPGTPRADIEAIADSARVTEFTDMLPRGLDTPVGEGGVGLSGGQAQRIALARALLVPKPLILLDEPTASLDEISEAEVLAALESLLARRRSTVVCATHRPAAMRWTDRLLRVEAGEIMEAEE